MENETPTRSRKLLNATQADLAKDRLGIPICGSCGGTQWIAGLDKKDVPCPLCTAELRRAQSILSFLDAIETTEIITADGCDRDVDPEGFGFSGEMLKLIRAIAEDENDVWNTAARCALAGPEPRDLQAVHWREAFDMAIGCIEFAATNKNDGPEFLVALRKYADLMIQELEPAADKPPADPEPGFCEQCNDPLSAEERHCSSGDLVFCSPECRDKYLAKL